MYTLYNLLSFLLKNSFTGVSDPALDDETFSWKGSFESALASDSRTRLSIEAKR